LPKQKKSTTLLPFKVFAEGNNPSISGAQHLLGIPLLIGLATLTILLKKEKK